MRIATVNFWSPRVPANVARPDAGLRRGLLDAWRRHVAPAGCATFQFRRHFVVAATYYDGEREIAVQAAMIQSRWAYLKQNWNRKLANWSWPYEGLETHTPRTLGSTNPDGSRPAYRPTRP